MFALHQSVKVLVKLFQKLAGLGRAHKKRRFLFAKLFLCASCAKEKAGLCFFMFFRGEENFLKKAFLPPNPHLSKTLKLGFEIYCNFCAQRSNNLCSHCTQARKFLVKFFSKNLRVWAEPIKNGAFFLPSFFFAPLMPKKKRHNDTINFNNSTKNATAYIIPLR